jgi:rare lipoprotein A
MTVERTEKLIARARAHRYVTAFVLVAACALAPPAFAAAESGGAGTGGANTGPSSTTGPSSSTTPLAQPANFPVSSSSDGITITTEASTFLSGGVSVTGSAPPGDAGKTIEIDWLAPSAAASSWVEAAVAPVEAGGSYSAVWLPKGGGQFTLRAELQADQAPSAAAAPPSVTVTVYRRSRATLYGPGFWGHRTACGEILRRRTLGVASRTLRCGTEVSIYYGGRTITVPVIDRGPYAYGANWDLTMATARALGMLETETIGAATVPAGAITAP